MVLAVLDSRCGTLTTVNAGHCPGILIRSDGCVETLESTGLPVGLFSGAEYTVTELKLHSGDLLCLYSDGITECENIDRQEFGVARLIELLGDGRDRPLEGIAKAIKCAVSEFAGATTLGDDQTVVLLRRP